MNHALLPSISQATLPVKYEAAKVALSECNRIDECKDWADKAKALASYAKQSEDKEMEMIALRIRARAVRRCGQLLQEIEKSEGGRPPKTTVGAHSSSPTRRGAAKEAGMSEHQQVAAIRVARVDGDLFEEQIESDQPPTITALADQGKEKAKGVPHYVQRGQTIKAFQAGMHFQGALATFATRIQEFDPQDVADGSTPKERAEIRHNIKTIDKYLNQLITKL